MDHAQAAGIGVIHAAEITHSFLSHKHEIRSTKSETRSGTEYGLANSEITNSNDGFPRELHGGFGSLEHCCFEFLICFGFGAFDFVLGLWKSDWLKTSVAL